MINLTFVCWDNQLGGPRPSWIDLSYKILLPHLCIVCFITFLAIYQAKFGFGTFKKKPGPTPPLVGPSFFRNFFWRHPLWVIFRNSHQLTSTTSTSTTSITISTTWGVAGWKFGSNGEWWISCGWRTCRRWWCWFRFGQCRALAYTGRLRVCFYVVVNVELDSLVSNWSQLPWLVATLSPCSKTRYFTYILIMVIVVSTDCVNYPGKFQFICSFFTVGWVIN